MANFIRTTRICDFVWPLAKNIEMSKFHEAKVEFSKQFFNVCFHNMRWLTHKHYLFSMYKLKTFCNVLSLVYRKII